MSTATCTATGESADEKATRAKEMARQDRLGVEFGQQCHYIEANEKVAQRTNARCPLLQT